MSLQTKGLTTEQLTQALKGTGKFSLRNGSLSTMKFSKKPLEAIKNIPMASQFVTKTDWDEHIQELSGTFKIEDSKVIFSDLTNRTSSFDLLAQEATVDFKQNVQAKVTWYPKPGVLSASLDEALKDKQGKASLPLVVTGNIHSPTVTPDGDQLKEKMVRYAQAKLVNQQKTQATQEITKRLPGALKGFLK